MKQDISTSKIYKRRLAGSKYHVWTDAHGNMQLCCYSKHEQGLVLVTKATIDAFLELPCEGTKSVRFANPVSQTDIVVETGELSVLDPIESGFGKPYYLVGSDTFAEENDTYPEPCNFM